jgi:hypothetical protein
MRSSQKKLMWILLAVVVFLVIVAAISVGIYLLMRGRSPAATGWQDPILQAQPAEVMPDLALYPLAGALPLETIDAAIGNGDLETAYATLAYSLDLSDAQRIGRLILLGRRFADAEKPDRAALAYQQIYDLAVLSPTLNDPARADALLSAGKGWAAVENETLALAAYGQVYTIAAYSPYLQRADRREMLNLLEIAYRDLGAVEAAEGCRQKIVELDQEPQSQPAATPMELPALPAIGEPISSAEVGALEETRRQATYALLQSLSGGGAPPAGQVNALAGALTAEDAAKLALYRQELEATTQVGRRIDVYWHLIHWLTLKEQVAEKAFGLSIVPEWEAQAADIRSALSTAYEGLFYDYEDQVTALPNASLLEPGHYQDRRLVTLAGRLGQYPNYPEQQMADKIREAVTKLIAAGFVQQLYVDQMSDDMGLRFFLSPASGYGTPAQGP